jgi:hypothetical protein
MTNNISNIWIVLEYDSKDIKYINSFNYNPRSKIENLHEVDIYRVQVETKTLRVIGITQLIFNIHEPDKTGEKKFKGIIYNTKENLYIRKNRTFPIKLLQEK